MSQVLLIFFHAFFLLPLCSEVWNWQHQCSYTNTDLQWKRSNREKTITACFMYSDELSCALSLPLTALAWHPYHEELFVSGSSDGSMIHWLVG
jgi:hypothetical protein